MAEVSASTIKKLTRELHDLQQTPCEGIRVIVNEQNLTDIQAEIEGPTGTPFEGGLFRMRLTLPSDFPNAPPKGFFITKIFHPNVSNAGDICVSVLKKDWTSETSIRHVLMVIRCLLIEPFPESALNEEAGKLLLEDYEEYAKHAQLMTSIHAQQPKRTTPLTASGANAASGPQDAKKEADVASSSSPVLKKAKPEQSKTGTAANMAKVKKSLKRL